MQPHEERVVTEYTELTKKEEKLDAFIQNSPTWHLLSSQEKSLLLEQQAVMKHYANILVERINLFHEKEAVNG